MKKIKVMLLSEFLNENIPPFLLGAFYSRYIFSKDERYIVTVASFRKSVKIDVPNFSFEKYHEIYIDKLNDNSGAFPFWKSKDEVKEITAGIRGQAFFILENDININRDSFFNQLYSAIFNKNPWIFEYGLTEKKKSFIRGFMELRGSIDTTLDFISQDYFYLSHFEIKKARLLMDNLSVPYNLININFRELQKQYYTNKNKRNTQLRLNIFWYMEYIGIINEYKAKIFQISRNLELTKKEKGVFYFNYYKPISTAYSVLDQRLNYYASNIFGKTISDEEIKTLRENIGFEESDETKKFIRSYELAELIRLYTPDECASCRGLYDIKERTFQNKRTRRLYFEIHHMISLGQNEALDDEDNLVKLCPICHKALKRGVATPEAQKEIIKDIYNNSPNVKEFAQHFFDTKSFEEIIEFTFQSLK